jgi:hypothetical protein
MSLPSRHDQQTVETASPDGEPIQWWYLNALISAPGTPVDGWGLISTFLRFGSAIEEGRFILIPSEEGRTPLDFGTRRLPPGTLTDSTDSVDVRIRDNFIRGGYPHYELNVAGTTRDDVSCSAHLSYEAALDPEHLTHIDEQVKHVACYRLNGEGTVTIGDDVYPVTAVGFYERVYGSFGWEPGETTRHVDGWNWYWSPAAGPEGVAVEVWSFFVEGDEQPEVYVAVTDGKDWHRFTSGTRSIVEQREIYGVPYPHKIRITDETEHGELDLVVTRRNVDARSLTGPGRPKRMYFISGFADFDGFARVDGHEYPLSGRAFGSAYEMSTDW